jgi:hypothetical protein
MPVFFLLFLTGPVHGQGLFRKMLDSRPPAAGRSNVSVPGRLRPFVAGLADATVAPTLDDFNPKTAGQGGTVVLTGTNFDNKSQVSFGGTAAGNVSVSVDGKTITATVGAGATGDVVVSNATTNTASKGGFIFADPPVITGLSQAAFSMGDNVGIIGKNFLAGATVTFDGVAATNVTVVSSTLITATVAGAVTAGNIIVSIPAVGSATWPLVPGLSAAGAGANADLTIPSLGQGLAFIPTPTFCYSNPQLSDKWGVTATLWGNSLGTDSSRQSVGVKILNPQLSQLGMKLEFDKFWKSVSSDNFAIAAVVETNLLLKKVSFFDTLSKNTTSFNPFVLHERVGITSAFIHKSFYASFYWNFLCVVTENAHFSDFFNTGNKNVFAYPEFSLGSLFNISSTGKQLIKVEFDFLINNGDANSIYQSANTLIPYFKAGFVTDL